MAGGQSAIYLIAILTVFPGIINEGKTVLLFTGQTDQTVRIEDNAIILSKG
jgi:hypothetical protein